MPLNRRHAPAVGRRGRLRASTSEAAAGRSTGLAAASLDKHPLNERLAIVSKLQETIAAPVEGALDERGGAVKLFLFYGGAIQLPLRAVKLGQGNDGELVTSPVPFYVVTHPRGNVVIDGGNAPEVAVDAVAHWGAIATTSTVIMSPEDALLPSLERVGIDLESIRWVLQTHLHIDHTGALAVIDRLPNAQVLVTH